ncbi:MAG: proline--tRNA ligase [Candidatus Magasanikbacteria bacterium]|nr:proline--tRNA ligase [Candidatus Magasanikbacteria bacterium]
MFKEKEENIKTTSGETKAISKRSEDYSQWYSDIIEVAGLAEHGPVKGTMVIKPYGYAVWENIQKILDVKFKEMGVENAYFPLFIPESFLKREKEHVEGFSPELAVVTHGGGKKLEEPLVVRPTSETIMYSTFANWIHSYRDLPLLINQWANVVRWEMRPRLFLRTTEFLWQEGHTAHKTPDEARDYAKMILLDVYKWFAQECLAIPVLAGQKSESEKFAGALSTFTIEALMQDGKSLQMGTAHDLSNHFAKSFGVMYLDENGYQQFVHQTSWGVSTRLIGGLIMSHSDDKGLVLPPKIAPIELVIVPIFRNSEDESLRVAKQLAEQLKNYFKVKLDERDNLRVGEKFFEWEKKGVPVRLELGPKDLAANQCMLVRRDTGEKIVCSLDKAQETIKELLEKIQYNLFNAALHRREDSTVAVDDWKSFEAALEKGGYVSAFWCEDRECEAQIKEKTKATTRCILFDAPEEKGSYQCVHCQQGVLQNRRWIFARAY